MKFVVYFLVKQKLLVSAAVGMCGSFCSLMSRFFLYFTEKLQEMQMLIRQFGKAWPLKVYFSVDTP